MVFQAEDTERADWQLLKDGAVTLFWNSEIYGQSITALKELNYNILEFDYDNLTKFCEDVSLALKWKEQFGYMPWTGNLNALNDGLYAEPLNSSKDTAFCIRNFHSSVQQDAEWSKNILDILESHSRNYLLYGCRLIILIQTDDAKYFCENIGGRRTQWNISEWMNNSRGL